MENLDLNIMYFKRKVVEIIENNQQTENESLSILNVLINNHYIFFNVFENLFAEYVLNNQREKSVESKEKIVKLTKLISSICGLTSQA